MLLLSVFSLSLSLVRHILLLIIHYLSHHWMSRCIQLHQFRNWERCGAYNITSLSRKRILLCRAIWALSVVSRFLLPLISSSMHCRCCFNRYDAMWFVNGASCCGFSNILESLAEVGDDWSIHGCMRKKELFTMVVPAIWWTYHVAPF